MLLNLSIGEYLVYGRLFGWPTTAALVFICGTFILREARRHGPPHGQEAGYSSVSSNPAAAAS